MTATANELELIKKKIDTLRDTIKNLEKLYNKAAARGVEGTLDLADEIERLGDLQFKLWRRKTEIVVNSPEWDDLIAGLKAVNDEIEKELEGLVRVVDVVKKATQLAKVGSIVLGAIG